MDINSFLRHHRITENPFAAEEARLDPVLGKLAAPRHRAAASPQEAAPPDPHAAAADTDAPQPPHHPEFHKIAGEPGIPSTAVVFGEKGSGKTTIRLRLAERIAAHNANHPDRRQLLVPYDDLNPILDNLLRAARQNPKRVLKNLRLADHQDAILSIAVTRIINGLLGEGPEDERAAMPRDCRQQLRRMPRPVRLDLTLLAMIYDRPHSDLPTERFKRLTRLLGTRPWFPALTATWVLAFLMLGTAVGFFVTAQVMTDPAATPPEAAPFWVWLVAWLTLGLGTFGLGYWVMRQAMAWALGRAIAKQVPAVGRSVGELKAMLLQWRPGELAQRPLPTRREAGAPESDSRYELTRRLIDAVGPLGYRGMTVLVDRVDEPTLIHADPDRMKTLVWPMFDNKFLKQADVGVKLLLPLELSRMVRQQGSDWFQAARLDKHNFIENLSWTGTTLYDLCNRRLNACRPDDADPITLATLFEDGVDAAVLIQALDQMHQPRDAFKFVHSVIQEHCRIVPEDAPEYEIAKLTLESVRRGEAQRVQDFHRGLTPA